MPSITERIFALGANDAERYDEIAERFENEWHSRQGDPPLIDDNLPDDELRLLVLVHLVKCDLELRLLSGEAVRAESYFARYPELAHDTPARLTVVCWEYQLRRDRAELAEYQRRFPELRAELQKQFGAQLESRSWQPPEGYELVRELPRGGMGLVFQVTDRQLKRPAVIKEIDPSRLGDPGAVERFQHEATLAGGLQHPNIVEVYAIGEAHGRPYFVMEFCGGGSLRDRLRDSLMVPDEAAGFVEILARAVQHAHEQGVIHRDLKSANVLFTSAGVPKVADFGLARQQGTAHNPTEAGQVVGTPGYMAPEQAEAPDTAGAPSDVYALGAVLYECLTGRPPFREPTPLATLHRALNYDPIPPSRLTGVPRFLEVVCLCCLSREPGRRYPSAGALADDLRRFLRREPIMARPPSLWERFVLWRRRRPAIALLTGIAGLLVVCVVGLSVYLSVLLANERALTRNLQEEKNRVALSCRGARGRTNRSEQQRAPRSGARERGACDRGEPGEADRRADRVSH